MSHCPSRHLGEAFVREMYTNTLTPAQVNLVLAVWEPFREQIEGRLADYDEDTQSWRDYRNSCFDDLPDPLDTANAMLVWTTCVQCAQQLQRAVGMVRFCDEECIRKYDANDLERRTVQPPPQSGEVGACPACRVLDHEHCILRERCICADRQHAKHPSLR